MAQPRRRDGEEKRPAHEDPPNRGLYGSRGLPIWAFAALSASPAARAFYDQRRAHGDRHAAALRRLFNRNLGQLHHCLQTRASYDETRAYPAFTATVDDDAKAA